MPISSVSMHKVKQPKAADDQRGKKRKKNIEYQISWELEPDLKGWLSQSRRVDGEAFCSLCNKDLEYKNGGLYDPKRHAQTESHKIPLQASQAQPSVRKAATKQDNLSVQVTNTELQGLHTSWQATSCQWHWPMTLFHFWPKPAQIQLLPNSYAQGALRQRLVYM